MKNRYRRPLLTLTIILTLLFSLVPLGAVKAEGEDPAPTDIPQAETQPGAEVPSPTEVAQALIEDATPVSTEVAPPTTGESSTPAPTVENVIALVPDGVIVVPLDVMGIPLIMAEETTANSYVSGDPIFCPGWALFGDPLCTGPLPSIEDAINAAAASGWGTIYVERSYKDLTPTPLEINGQNWQFGQYSTKILDLIGGVDFKTGKVIGKTTLNRPISISNLYYFTMQNFIISGVEGTAVSVDSTDNAQIINSDLSENTGAAIIIDSNGNAGTGHVNAENNGEKSRISGTFVSVSHSNFSGNSTDGGLEVRSNDGEYLIQGDINIEFSSFNNNAGTGLFATADGSIFVLCSEAMNNTSVDTQFQEVGAGGMFLNAPGFREDSGSRRDGDVGVWCSKASGNDSYGLVANASGTIYTASNSFINNGLIDFVPLSPNEVVEQTVPCDVYCPVCDRGSSGSGEGGSEEKPSEGNTQVVIVKVGEGDGTAEIKPEYSTVFKLYEQQEEKERLVQLTVLASGSAPSGSSAVYTPLDESKLPAPLPEGASLIPWGFNLAITNQDGSAVESLIGYMLIRFYLPEGFVLPGGMRLVIQHFDPAISSWTPMSTAVGGGTAYTFASKPGTYVLTMVPIE